MAKAAISKSYSVVRRMDVAREIAHDVFIKLWKAGGKFPNDKAVYVWIYKACHRAGIDYLRSAQYRYEKSGEDYAASPDEARSSFADLLVSRETLDACVKQLSQDEADVLVYTTLDRMTQAEVADLMGTSVRTVQRVQARIEERLKIMKGQYA